MDSDSLAVDTVCTDETILTESTTSSAPSNDGADIFFAIGESVGEVVVYSVVHHSHL